MPDGSRISWQDASLASSALEVRLLGLVRYDAALALQQRLVDEIAARTDTRGGVLLCEHPPVISLGCGTTGFDYQPGDLAPHDVGAGDAPPDWELIAAHSARPPARDNAQIPVVWTARGGGAWLLTPGVLAFYAVIPIERLGVSPFAYRECLEQTLVDVARDLDIEADVVPTSSGAAAATPGIACRCGQIGYLGVAVRDGITTFGGALLIAPPREVVEHIPWTPGGRVSTFAAQRQRPTTSATVRESLMRHLAENLGYSEYHLLTGHPWLKRTREVFPAVKPRRGGVPR